MFKIASYSLASLVFMALFVPTTYLYLKAPLLAVSFSFSVFLVLKRKIFINKSTLIACSLLSLFGLFNSLHGQFNGNPGAFRVLTVLALWPLVYMVLSSLLTYKKSILAFNKLLWFTSVILVIYSFTYIGYEKGIVPSFFYIEIDQGQEIGFYEGFTEYNLYSISSLLFLTPFVYYWVIKKYNDGNLDLKLTLFFLSITLLAVLTGRRAVQLTILISPLLIIASNKVLGIKKNISVKKQNSVKKIQIFILLILGAIILYSLLISLGLDFSVLSNLFVDGFNFESGDSTSERTMQFHSLINGWSNGNILLGMGNGANTELIRSDEQPWAYELTYVYLLFSNGIAGVLFYFIWFGWGLWRLRKASLNNPSVSYYIAAILTGVFALAIGAASNPYFGKFDYLWIIILPHLLAGVIKYQKSTENHHDLYYYSKLERRSSIA